MKLSIIIPTFNEGATIQSLVDDIVAVKFPIEYEIIIIDDASIDRTFEKADMIRDTVSLNGENILIFKNRVNRGKGFSIRKGIRRSSGDIVFIQDADREYDPSDIPQIIQPIISGEFKAVFGSRFINRGYPQNMALPNFIGNKILTFLVVFLFGLKISDEACCYKAFDSNMIKQMNLKANRFNFDPEISAKIAKKGIKIREIPVKYKARSVKEGKKIRAIDFFFAVGTLIKERLTK